MAKQKTKTPAKSNGATVGYEQQLWQMADALRGSMDATEYKHVVLGAFEEHGGKLEGPIRKILTSIVALSNSWSKQSAQFGQSSRWCFRSYVI